MDNHFGGAEPAATKGEEERTMTEEARLAKKYHRFGITESFVRKLVRSGLKRGISYKAALTGVRMVLGHEFHQPEYFTAEDVAEATGETVEEVDRRIKEHEAELMAAGGIVKVMPAPGFERFFS